MNIVMVTAYFPPEIGSAAHLFFELGRELVRRGYTVTVITGYPTYNVDQNTLPAQYREGWFMKESMNGMNVLRVRPPGMPRHIPVLRGIGQFIHSLELAWVGVFRTGISPDIILVYSPPLFLGKSASFIRFVRGGKLVLNIQDLFPQSAIDLGLLRNNILITFFRWLESHLYKIANLITVHSEGNKTYVESHGGHSDRTRVIPNLVDVEHIKPGKRDNSFRQSQRLDPQAFIISFAGVIGYSQDLDTVVGAAKLLVENHNIIFYIVGDGMEKSRLMKLTEGMENIRFLPMLPKEKYVELLHASDACLVTLRSEVKTPVVPSKILSIMAAGRPVIASLPLEGDAPEIIRDAQCGVCIEPGNATLLADAIHLLYKDPERCASFGKNGRTYVESHFSLDVCTTLYEQGFNDIMKNTLQKNERR